MNFKFASLLILFSFPSYAIGSSSFFDKAHDDIEPNKYTGIDSVIVYKNGKLLMERYYSGFTESTKHRTHSTFKSVTALITLIAVEQKILSLDEPAISLLERFRKLDNPNRSKKRIKVRHLLEMTSGLDCDESPGGSGPNHEFGIDEGATPLAYGMEIKMATEPGTRWNYCNANSFLLAATISGALERANREDIFSFAKKYLLSPLGITDFRFTTSQDGKFLNGQGNAYFLPKDLAKIGFLILNRGQWNGSQIISDASIQLLTKQGHEVNWYFTDLIKGMRKTESFYSNHWYNSVIDVKGKSIKLIHSWGNGGQFIFIIPSLNSVIVFTGSNQGNFTKQKQPFEILHQYIIPQLMNKIN